MPREVIIELVLNLIVGIMLGLDLYSGRHFFKKEDPLLKAKKGAILFICYAFFIVSLYVLALVLFDYTIGDGMSSLQTAFNNIQKALIVMSSYVGGFLVGVFGTKILHKTVLRNL
ncbi:hypothetical protein A2533_04820 [Candidatus Falkowbacteria bacterium RIFOXYD2_FULL_35_9]|uniref:Uncharacterized protein n=1 Tax=Candidatus Falkowbacteria bacterium RIFOXYC2_FULL_36_12 TaxID=1798002 RepID=A0A1F5SY98_9BACT|nr:MAG: hypothetical protein A2478_04385 [Candidatus Falkowbacteria bacterium RIFOXYC2_FULL_36_12]OGF33177.1 MAG: hypothetical protein A2223_04910 [Candidatus Falkowbacteria bacterium RIFOXYA2_FULL_35_8]OGF46177.1 MAG: hypothetical protein A2533_04820 [Candidatus Falkowbacteria bacterium RIFOXYD2_FULL_35_9]